MDVKQSIREFIAQNFYVPSSVSLTDDGSLLDLGIVDSTGVLEVIVFLEKTFQIRIEDAEVTPENLDSIARIAAFVVRKHESASADS